MGRLEEIAERAKFATHAPLDMEAVVALDTVLHRDIPYLLEQAERVSELEAENERLRQVVKDTDAYYSQGGTR